MSDAIGPDQPPPYGQPMYGGWGPGFTVAKSFSTAPTTVKVLVVLGYVSAGFGLFGALVFLAIGLVFTSGNLGSFTGPILLIAPSIVIGFAALQFFLARGLARGSRAWWIVAMVFVGLGLLSGISRLGQGSASLSLLLVVAESVLLVLPDTRNYCTS